MTRYYENGSVQSTYDVAKKKETQYFPSGTLKRFHSWSSRSRHKIKEYDEKGNKTLIKTSKRQKKFYSHGTVQETIRRKEILVFDRIFSKYKGRSYENNWTSFDSSGTITRKIIFSGNTLSTSAYPNNYKEIEDFLFSEIVFYKAGVPVKKIYFLTRMEGDVHTKYLVLATMTDGEWIEEKEATIDQVYQIISSLSR